MKSETNSNCIFLLFVFLWGLTFFLLNSPPLLDDYDTYWHITAGNWILEKKQLILPNSWSFSSPDHFWYNISWLWDILSSFIYNEVSGKWLFFFDSLINSLTITLTALYLKQKNNLNNISILFTIFVLSLVMWDFAVSRPQIATYLFSICYLLLTELYNSKKETKYLIPLPIIMLLWVNMHGGFIAGCLILVFRFLENWKKAKTLKKTDRLFFLFCLITALSILVNPYHFKIIYAVTSTTASNFTKAIDEWQAYKLGNNFFPFAIYLFLFILSFNVKNKQVSLVDKLNAIIWLFLALLHVRNIPIFAVLSSAFFATNIQQLNILKKLDFLGLNTKRNISICLLLNLLVCVFYFSEYMPDKITSKKDPKNAIEFLIKNYPNQNFLNDYSMGGAIIFYGNGNQKVFVDGRAGTAYPEEVLQEYLDIPMFVCQKNYQIMKKYNIKGYVLAKEKMLHKALQNTKEWHKIYADKYYVVYEFRDPSDLP